MTLSAAISLLALSPVVLPSGTPLERLPGPLAGVQSVGRIVAHALAPPAGHRERTASEEASAPADAPPAGSADTGSGVLAENAGSSGANPRPHQPAKTAKPAPALSPPRSGPERPSRAADEAERHKSKAVAKVERRVERAEAKAGRKEENAAEKTERKQHKEHGHGRVGSSSGHGKKSDKPHDKKGGKHS